jgi:glyoxylase-like metal-dependent hydrolase (beta-lactamase superfamily II)
MLQRDVAAGIHRVEDAYTNWYLVEDGSRLTVVDAGVPTSWNSLEAALAELRRTPADIAALVLTHAHFDHVGFAERLRRERGTPVWVHERDVPLTRHPLKYRHESSRTRYLLTKPKALPIIFSLARHRAFFARPISDVRVFGDGTLDVPGSPHVVETPGHTFGHVSLHFPERDVAIAGDAVVTLNPYTGEAGPQIVARAATADSRQALASLDALAATGARTILTGHGEPWHGGAAEIAAQAQVRGAT